MLFEMILPLGLVLPGLGILKFARIRVDGKIELLSYSYVLSLAIMFVLLYLGGMAGAFGLASLIFLMIMILSSVFLCARYATNLLHSEQRLRTSLNFRGSGELLIAVVLIIGLLAVYAVFLSTRAILDSDVVQLYLPLAREIATTNEFTFGTGYDYVVYLKPIGASVIYAWVYVMSGSILTEEFRLMPLVPILVMIALNYQISVEVTKSRNIGIVSTAIFLILPFQDRFLHYNAFYPDIFYYPSVLLVIYLMIKVIQTKQEKPLLWIGLSLGVASLLKAQTVYFLLPALLVLVVYQANHRKVSLILCSLTPFYILVPTILAQPSYLEGTALFASILSPTQLVLFIFLAALSGICYLLVSRNARSSVGLDQSAIRSLAKRMVMVLAPFVALSSLWYVSNLLRFGTLVYTSPIGLPNYDWALQVLSPLGSIAQQASPSDYLVYFVFAFLDPAVMGYVMLVPLLIGLFVVFRRKLEGLKLLLFIEIISVSLVLSNAALSISSSIPGYNPRDLLPLAPLLATLSAVGISYVASDLRRNSRRTLLIPFLLVAYFGFMNYLLSVLVWFTALHYETSIGSLLSAFGGIAGLNLTQASLQIAHGQLAAFVGENALRLLLISLLAGAPVMVLLVFRRYDLLAKLRTKFGKITQKPHSSRHSNWKHSPLIRNGFLVFIMLSVIIVPRAEMYVVQGATQQIRENQLETSYHELYGLLGEQFEGDILTFKARNGLPYYLQPIKVIDLVYPGNLAVLRDCFQSIQPSECAAKMRNYGIRYLLIDFSDYSTYQLDSSLNSTFLRIVQNTSLASLVGVFGSWKLYDLAA